MTKNERLEEIKKKYESNFGRHKKIGVAVRTSSSIAYGWIDDDFETELDKLWGKIYTKEWCV